MIAIRRRRKSSLNQARVRDTLTETFMPTLHQLFPDPDVLLALASEELGGILLGLAKSQLQNGMVHLSNISQVTAAVGMTAHHQSPWVGRERGTDPALCLGRNGRSAHGLAGPAS